MRARDAFFVVADIVAIMEQPSVTVVLDAGETLDPENAGQDPVELDSGQGYLEKVMPYYVAQQCTKMVDIHSLRERYVSFKESLAFKALEDPTTCKSCRHPDKKVYLVEDNAGGHAAKILRSQLN